jgi:hypothetical protein
LGRGLGALRDATDRLISWIARALGEGDSGA